MDVVDGNRVPLGYQQLTSLGSAVGLTLPSAGSPVARPARLALLQAEDQAIRFRDDGVNPTSSTGMRLLADGSMFPYTGDLSALRFIEESAGGKLNVLLYY